MIKRIQHLPALLLAGALSLAASAEAVRADRVVTMGTGSVTGVYYPVGGAICSAVNAAREFHGLRCLVESTAGSVDNARRVAGEDLDFAIVQSDMLWKAIAGEPPFEEPLPELRAVFALHFETAVLAVPAASDIHSAADIRGRRINLGRAGSGSAAMAVDALAALGLTLEDLGAATRMGFAEQNAALSAGEIDGFFALVGHPSHGLRDLFFRRDMRLVSLKGAGIDALVQRHPFYVHGSTPGDIYRGVPQPVPTLAVKAILIAGGDVATRTVYDFAKSIYLKLDLMKLLHPALGPVTAGSLTEGFTAPMHEGACRFLQSRELPRPE